MTRSRPRTELLPYGRPALDPADIEAVTEVLKTSWLTRGPMGERFERAFAEAVGVREAVAVSSGTAALHAAMEVAGFGPGDEVITTPLSFVASANAIVYQGATPVFADIDPRTLNLDPDEVEKKITPRTRGLLAVHYAGQPCEMERLRALAEAHGLTLMEDACHAMGARYRGRPAGALGDVACFSFHALKPLTTGEGGMIVTDRTDWAAHMRTFRHHGIVLDPAQQAERGAFYSEMRMLGFNYRLTDFQCALGLSQLAKEEERRARRRAIAERYLEAFAGREALELPEVAEDVAEDIEHAWHLFVVLLRLDRLGMTRERFLEALREAKIGTSVHYPPIHLQPYYRKRFGFSPGLCPHAEAAYERMVSLPLFPSMTDEDVEDVIEAVLDLT